MVPLLAALGYQYLASNFPHNYFKTTWGIKVSQGTSVGQISARGFRYVCPVYQYFDASEISMWLPFCEFVSQLKNLLWAPLQKWKKKQSAQLRFSCIFHVFFVRFSYIFMVCAFLFWPVPSNISCDIVRHCRPFELPDFSVCFYLCCCIAVLCHGRCANVYGRHSSYYRNLKWRRG